MHTGTPAEIPSINPATLATRGRIAAAGMKLFARKGYAATSVREISAAARVNVAAVSYHFGSKAGLYRHILQGFGGKGLKRMAAVLLPPADPEDFRRKITEFLTLGVDNLVREPEIPRILRRDYELIPEICGDMIVRDFTAFQKSLGDFMRAARDRHVIRRDIAPELIAQFIDNQLAALVQRITAGMEENAVVDVGNPASVRQWIAATAELLLTGIAADQPDGVLVNSVTE